MRVRFRFVHAADLHLDTPFRGIAQVAPDVARALREASLEAFDALIELTLRREASFLLLAGDIYDGPVRGLRAQRRLRDGFERLGAAGIGVFLVHGNHDPLSEGWTAIDRWPANVRAFGSERVESAVVEVHGTPVARVHGISFAQPAEPRNLARLFAREGDGLQVGLLHGNVGDPEHAPYAPCSVQDLRDAGMDYWALGHVHRRSLPLQGGPWAVYPGVLQGRHPAPGEQGPKGAVVVECDSALGVLGEPEFVELDRVRFAAARVEMPLDEGALAALDRALGEIQALQRTAGGRGVIVRIGFDGRTAAHDELVRRRESGELLEELRAGSQGLQPFVWVDDVDVETSPPIDREAVRSRGDFAAEIVRTVDRLAAEEGQLAALAERILAEIPGGGKTLRLRDMLPALDRSILDRAEAECLRLLAGDDAP